jgi:uncharacterized protein (DUF983 family)
MASLRIGSILRARCPACHQGAIMRGIVRMNPRCPSCGYDFNPEDGFHLCAMSISFLLTGLLTIPPLVLLKILGVDIVWLVAFPFIEFIFVGTLLMFYSKVLWLHLEYRMTRHLDGKR